jgi:RNA polymerase sigma-70 factor (ECF subfamily)
MTALTAEDAELVTRLRRGDGAAARELYQRHGAALLRFGLAMSNSRQTAEDIVHDTFVEILKHPIRFDPSRGSVLAYLFGIARHRMSRIARVSMRDSGKPLELSEGDALDLENFTDAGDELDRVRDIKRVRAAVFDLPRAHREVVALCDLEELPYATAADILGCPIGTVRSRLSRARALLATRLAPAEEITSEDEEEEPAVSRPSAEMSVDDAALSLSCRGSLT